MRNAQNGSKWARKSRVWSLVSNVSIWLPETFHDMTKGIPCGPTVHRCRRSEEQHVHHMLVDCRSEIIKRSWKKSQGMCSAWLKKKPLSQSQSRFLKRFRLATLRTEWLFKFLISGSKSKSSGHGHRFFMTCMIHMYPYVLYTVYIYI